MQKPEKKLTKAELILELQAAREQIAELKNSISCERRGVTETTHSVGTTHPNQDTLYLLFRTMPLGVVFQDTDGRIIEANAAAQQTLGIPFDQLYGRTSLDPCWKAIHEDGSEFPGDIHPAMVALRTGQPVNNVVMGVHNPATGTYRWININAVPQFGPDEKNLIGVQVTFEDFTERKQAEAALKFSEENYRSLAENSESAITVLDRNGRLLYANPWTVNIWKNTDVTGKTIFDLFPQEYAARYSASINKVIDTGTRMFDDVETCINGEMMWFRLSMSPIRDPDGAINKLLVNAWDVTRRKLAENALRKSNQILQESQSIAQLGSWTADLEAGTFETTPEAARLIGRSPGLLTTAELLEIIHPEDREYMLTKWNAALRGEPYELEHRILINGEVRWLHVKAVFSMWQGDKPTSALGINQDITERKRAEKALVVSEKKLRSLVNSESHYVLRTDLEGSYTYCNRKYEEDFGWLHPGSLIGTSALESICDYHHGRMFETIEKCNVHPGKAFKAELDKPAKEGGIRTTLWEFVSLADENDRPYEIQCMGMDITDRKRAEEALRASEEKYRGLMESLDSILYTVDYDGNLLYLNEIAAKQLGGSPQDYLNKNVYELFPEPIASARLRNLRKVIQEDRGIDLESKVLVNDQPRWYRTTIQPIHNETGQVIYALINSTDIHDLKTAQEELLAWSQTLEERVREHTAEVQDLYDNAPTGYHSVDVHGNFVMINQTELRWLGYTRDEVLGHPVKEFLESTSKTIYETNFLIFKERGWLKDLELEFVRKDGTLLPISLSSIAVYDRDGNYSISRSTVFDNTERKRAAQKLRESEERYRKAISAADAVPYDLDYASNAYTFIGEGIEKLSGYSREEMTPALFESIIEQSIMQGDPGSMPAEAATKQVRVGEKSAAHAVWRSDFLIKHKNGEERWLSDISLQVVDASGKITGSIGILQNITERKKAEETLRLANIEMERALRIKDEFLTSMSHELRTPLTGILGLSEALQYEMYGGLNEGQRTALVNIESSGRHLLDLINDILDISKLEAGKLDLHLEPCALSEIGEAALQLIKGMAHKKNQTVAYSMEPASITVLGDARRLKQILVNLLSNAVKYSHENTRIGLEVNADRQAGTVKLTVWDSGIGIMSEDIKKLFKPFVQLDSSLTRQQTGTGLGLALVQRLVSLHSGTIEVESKPGQGSRFTVTLSTLPDDAIQWRRRGISALKQPQQALIIEDINLDADHLARNLKMLGIDSTVHPSGSGVVDRAVEVRPNMIFLDLLLPDASGWDVMTQLKNNPATSNIPIIITSVMNEQEQAFERGAAGYLVKFFTQSDLYLAIERVHTAIPTDNKIKSHWMDFSNPHSATVMVVDDNEVNVYLMRDFLRSMHFNIAIARSGLEFLARVAEVQPDLVLMDIQMPGMDGLETILRLRANPDLRLAALPVIAITALAMPGDRERCLQAGANEYISKPMHLEHLANTIQKMLEKEL